MSLQLIRSNDNRLYLADNLTRNEAAEMLADSGNTSGVQEVKELNVTFIELPRLIGRVING